VACPEGLRGALHHTLDRCTGCQICAYVCSPAAISFQTCDQSSTLWEYFTGRCTFCGRCVEYCPTGALDFGRDPPPVIEDPRQHRLAHEVIFPPCPRCGRSIQPMPEALLVRLYSSPLPREIQARQGLCERCRARMTAEALKVQAGGRRRD
jgi:ferredoxin